jgi:hypothetical protein
MVLPPGQYQNVDLSYDLEPSVIKTSSNGFEYSLRVQKQAGIKRLPLTLQLKIPDGYALISPEPGWQASSEGGGWQWAGVLTQSVNFKLVFERH